MAEYIDRQKAIDAINCDITITGRQNAELVAATIGTFADRIKALSAADVVPVETLQAKISELKYQMNCKTPNIDYYTGYMSALSTVEGIIAKMDMEG